MQKIYTFLFATTCFSYSAWAQPLAVASFSDLILELENNSNASVVFDANDIQNIDGYLTITEQQSVDLENISSWKNSNKTFEISGNEYTAGINPNVDGENHLISNQGYLTIKNVSVKNNNLFSLLVQGQAVQSYKIKALYRN